MMPMTIRAEMLVQFASSRSVSASSAPQPNWLKTCASSATIAGPVSMIAASTAVYRLMNTSAQRMEGVQRPRAISTISLTISAAHKRLIHGR